MQNRTPATRETRPALPAFTPVPRKPRHDGWTPERQRAFIEALADTGSVSRAAAMVNMAQTNCYTLRRAPGAEEFRRAWEAALDFGVQRLKDIAFERAIEGQLVPVFVAGKLMGFRRKRNDALLMFCLRHYGQDGAGRRTTINYFSSRASAGTANDSCGPTATAEASATTVRTVISGEGGTARIERDDDLAATIASFEGVPLDAEAAAAINAALIACADRQRSADASKAAGGDRAALVSADDPDEPFVRVGPTGDPYHGELIPPVDLDDYVPFCEGEADWRSIGGDDAGTVAAVRKRPKRRRVVRPNGTG